MLKVQKLLLSGIFVALVTLTLGSQNVQARERVRAFRHAPVAWQQGHWIHDRHSGRLGWWWVVGPSWIYYDRPHSFVVAPAPQPQVVVVQQQATPPPEVVMAPPPVTAPPPVVVAAPASPVLYYCKATGTHYPETMSCPGGWMTLTAQTPPQPVNPQ